MAVAPAFPLPLLGGRPCRRLLVFLQAAVFRLERGGRAGWFGFPLRRLWQIPLGSVCGVFGESFLLPILLAYASAFQVISENDI